MTRGIALVQACDIAETVPHDQFRPTIVGSIWQSSSITPVVGVLFWHIQFHATIVALKGRVDWTSGMTPRGW